MIPLDPKSFRGTGAAFYIPEEAASSCRDGEHVAILHLPTVLGAMEMDDSLPLGL